MHVSFKLGRRATLLGLTSCFSLAALGGPASLALASVPTRERFVVVLMRGALDGLAAVTPYGDRNLRTWRPDLDPGQPGTDKGLLDLGGFFGLHPAMTNFHAMYQAGELLPAHAVAGPYRNRSHFQAQDCMESGTDHLMESGWLNRAVKLMPMAQRKESPAGMAISMGLDVPLILRGTAPVGTYAQPHGGTPDPDLYARIAAMAANDPLIGPAIVEGLKSRTYDATTLAQAMPDPQQSAPLGGKGGFVALAGVAGTLLAAQDGPRIAVLEIGGWDTHAGQKNRLPPALSQLDQGIAALKQSLGAAWTETVVLVMTEFGRTVRANGTGGTDHGTGTIAFLAGGKVHGGRVLANWPGLAPGQLYQDRDLQPTLDVRALALATLTGHLGLPRSAMAQIFPDHNGLNAPHGLLRV